MKKVDVKDFINFWEKYYNEGKYLDKIYYSYINDLSKDDFLDKLWFWKMGPRFFKKYQKQLQLIKEKKETIRNFRKSNPNFNTLYNFSREIFKTGPVYSVFLMHICKPQTYPIFDQHVFRAFIFLTKKEVIDMPKDIQDYLNYRKFVFQIHKKYKIKLRDIDKALMAFGQFLANPKLK